MENILLENGYKQVRTVGTRKEFERTIGVHTVRVRPTSKQVTIEYETRQGIKVSPSKVIKVTEEEAVMLIKAFDTLKVILM